MHVMISEAKSVIRRCDSENNVDYLQNSYLYVRSVDIIIALLRVRDLK